MPDEALIIDDVNIERARTPRPAAPTPRAALDPFQHAEQRLGRQPRVEQSHGIDISRLARAADRRRLVEWRHGKHGDMSALDFA
jgi:hypothetical protein